MVCELYLNNQRHYHDSLLWSVVCTLLIEKREEICLFLGLPSYIFHLNCLSVCIWFLPHVLLK